MKIGVLITYFHPFKDGTENQCLYWCRELAKKHKVTLFTSDRKEGQVIEQKQENFEGLDIKRYETIFRYKYYLCWNQGLITDLLKADLDVLLVHSIGFPQQDLAVLLLKLLKPKLRIVNFPHGPFLANKNNPLSIKIFREIYRIFEKSLNGLYDAVIDCNGKQKETWMPCYFPDLSKVYYCPDGIPSERFKKVSHISGKNHKLKNNKNCREQFLEWKNSKAFFHKFIIAQLGRLIKYKGQEQVVKVLPEIIKKHKDVVFLLMGADKGYKTELESLAKSLGVEKNVVFAGEVSEDDKLRYLDLAEIICFTSMPGTEAFGIVLLEGMARKCAGISTKVENGSTAVVHGETGFVYDYDDLESLKKYLLQMVEDKKLLQKMQEKSFARAKEFVNEDIVWKYLEPILRGML